MQSMQLVTDEVHVCCISLNAFSHQTQVFSQLLSLDERRKADRFHFASDKKRFIIVRGILRQIVSFYLDVNPIDLEFTYSRHGKPALTGTFSESGLHFNVSHSEGLALFAFALDRDIGVDIEFIQNIPELEQIVERFFSCSEKEIFRRLPENRKKYVFYQMWTRKEAFLKAVGKGLHISLDSFTVFPILDEPVAVLNNCGSAALDIPSGLYVNDLHPWPGFAGAFAVEGKTSHCWIHWPVTSI